ncbi:MAG: substrate-binding domain-containing protein [Flavisolibacter sp.]|nr:substrate-binding domain-containing protein [Flavisolibacter sp.]
MSIRHKPFLFLFIIGSIVLTSFTACTEQKRKEHFVIGFSQCVNADAWRRTMLMEMKRELSFHDNITFLVRDAAASSETQIRQIKELVAKKVDLLIVSPNEVHPLSAIIQEVYESGVPVVVVDRRTDSKQYSAFIGASNFEVGQNAGRYAALLLKGKGKVLEVTGLPDASPVIDRHNRFMDVIRNYPGITYVKKVEGNWDVKPFAETVEAALQETPGIDVVYAQNDRMGFEVYKICQRLALADKIKIIGIDGLALPGEGLDMVENRNLVATVLYPTGGQEAIMTAVNLLESKPYKKENQLFTTIIDSSNVRIVKAQNQKVQSLQKDIDQRQAKINQQMAITRNQTNAIITISGLLLLALLLGAVTFYYLRENKQINRRLHIQNEEIRHQQAELIEMSAKAQAANAAKVNFFTNISHEFKTPLTLILAPLEELMAHTKNQYQQNRNLQLIHKNVIRLLRLVNQLMDFRKIEVEQMKVRASENDIISFIADIIQSYKSIAHNRSIDLRLITNERQLNVWFDANMLDKVIFNLLSNAFKFTDDNGYIYVYISKSEDGKEAVIKVEDNGVGMTGEAQAHAFDVFYQGEYKNYKGTGLGLALSKELIRLHKGSISVSGEQGKGTTFEIHLPLGNAHLEKGEIAESEAIPSLSDLYEQEKIYTADLEEEQKIKREPERITTEKEYSILIIEDNPELREFIANRFSAEYEILEADNGQAALQQAFDAVPDLIICDIVIPGKDGIAITHILKNDIRTSHIPIVLLTAKTSMEQQIEGMKNRADAYITKPFNVQYLEQTMKSLLSNRARLKEHFTGDFSSHLKTQTVSKLDRKFVNDFKTLVESNLSNEDFNVEEICKTMGISRVQLYRKVKALLSANVNDYILHTRLQKAKYFLQHEESTISEIAYKVGFSSPAYFSAVFKSKFGVSPKAFKEK